jgi:hypothetical protein
MRCGWAFFIFIENNRLQGIEFRQRGVSITLGPMGKCFVAIGPGQEEDAIDQRVGLQIAQQDGGIQEGAAARAARQ